MKNKSVEINEEEIGLHKKCPNKIEEIKTVLKKK